VGWSVLRPGVLDDEAANQGDEEGIYVDECCLLKSERLPRYPTRRVKTECEVEPARVSFRCGTEAAQRKIQILDHRIAHLRQAYTVVIDSLGN
jgi:hypothetical protein